MREIFLAGALRATRNRLTWLTVIFGALLTFFSFTIVTGILLAGYWYRILADSAETGAVSGAGFTELQKNLRDGFGVYALWFGYFLIPLILGETVIGRLTVFWDFVLFYFQGIGLFNGFHVASFVELVFGPVWSGLMQAFRLQGDPSVFGFLQGNALFLYLTVGTAAFALFVFPAALANAATADDLRSGLRLRTVVGGSLTVPYVVSWSVATFVTVGSWSLVYAVIFLARLFPGTNFFTTDFGVVLPSVRGVLFFGSAFLAATCYFVSMVFACELVGRAWHATELGTNHREPSEGLTKSVNVSENVTEPNRRT
jgi:hypothetical protein